MERLLTHVISLISSLYISNLDDRIVCLSMLWQSVVFKVTTSFEFSILTWSNLLQNGAFDEIPVIWWPEDFVGSKSSSIRSAREVSPTKVSSFAKKGLERGCVTSFALRDSGYFVIVAKFLRDFFVTIFWTVGADSVYSSGSSSCSGTSFSKAAQPITSCSNWKKTIESEDFHLHLGSALCKDI